MYLPYDPTFLQKNRLGVPPLRTPPINGVSKGVPPLADGKGWRGLGRKVLPAELRGKPVLPGRLPSPKRRYRIQNYAPPFGQPAEPNHRPRPQRSTGGSGNRHRAHKVRKRRHGLKGNARNRIRLSVYGESLRESFPPREGRRSLRTKGTVPSQRRETLPPSGALGTS